MTTFDIVLRIAILILCSLPFIAVLIKSKKGENSGGNQIEGTEKLILFVFWIVLIIALLVTFF